MKSLLIFYFFAEISSNLCTLHSNFRHLLIEDHNVLQALLVKRNFVEL